MCTCVSGNRNSLIPEPQTPKIEFHVRCLTAMQRVKLFTVVLFRNQWKGSFGVYPALTDWTRWRRVHTSCTTQEFHEYDKRSGYDTGLEIADTRTERIRLGLKQLKKEIKLWKKEIQEVLISDPIFEYRAGTINTIN